ncbi:MAG: C45 family peptidase [Chthoniobacteraceae bacterium]
MKHASLLALLLAALALPAPLRAEPAANERFATAIQKLTRAFDAKAAEPAELQTTLEVLSGENLPKAVRHAKIEVSFSAPDHLRLATQIGDRELQLGRLGQEIWVWAPGKNFGVRGLSEVPRFSADPASIEETKLPAFQIPLDPVLLEILPRLFDTKYGQTETIDGEVCREVIATPLPQAGELLKMGNLTLTMWLRDKDGLPARIRYDDGKSIDVEVALHDLRIGQRRPDADWQIPAPKGAKVEKVALSHLVKFFEAAVASLKSKLPTLGPATGERILIATHGAGRLEMLDGTRVLFLKGTPEEMGEQGGVLLDAQVDDVVERVLYGVGVGSSFEKGEWFFGTIESCTDRISPFIDPRYLREMDALAAASGHHPQEIRLANFFPELFHCSGFALLGSATEGGRIYHGRILDYLKGIGLEQNAVVTVNQPDQGHAWVNVGYAGFIGSVTAMNDQHISIGEMGGRGEGNWDGKPMAQLLREVMEKAGTLEEAIEIMRSSPRTCEYYYVIADGRAGKAVGIKATPELFEVVHAGEAHPQLDTPVKDTVLLSAGDRYKELVKRVQKGFGKFDADSARDLMTRPVCMGSNIHSVLFAPDTLDFWVANADGENVASHTRYTKYNLGELLR